MKSDILTKNEKYFLEIIDVMRSLQSQEIAEKIEAVTDLVVDNYIHNGLLLVCGNGGSAADAQHIVAEHVGAYLDRNRKAFPAVSLTTDTSNMTAISNDYGYDEVFRRQVEAFDNIPYVLIGISTSGKSPNVNKAIIYAKQRGRKTIGLSGKNGGELEQIADYCITIPGTSSTPIIQTAHNAVYHRICELVEEKYKSLRG